MNNLIDYITNAPWVFMTGIVATLLMLWVCRGWMPMAVIAWREKRHRAKYLTTAVVLTILGSSGRTLYWAGIAAFYGDPTWQTFDSPFRAHWVDVIFSLITIAGALCGLKVLHLLIPEDEQENWSIWSAPRWPRKSIWPFVQELRELWHEKKQK